jgi:hypothetical protein
MALEEEQKTGTVYKMWERTGDSALVIWIYMWYNPQKRGRER